jgi:hypothetical protein
MNTDFRECRRKPLPRESEQFGANASAHQPAVLEFRPSEIQQESDADTRRFQVIQNLSLVNGLVVWRRRALDKHAALHNQVAT